MVVVFIYSSMSWPRGSQQHCSPGYRLRHCIFMYVCNFHGMCKKIKQKVTNKIAKEVFFPNKVQVALISIRLKTKTANFK